MQQKVGIMHSIRIKTSYTPLRGKEEGGKSMNRKKIILLALPLAVIAFTVVLLNSGCSDKIAALNNQVGDHTGSIVWDGLERTYLIYIPSSYNKTKPMPLVIALHGGAGTSKGMVELTRGGFNTLADKEGFIVVYPDAIDKHWNDFRNDMLAVDVEDIDDVGFISALIDYLVETLNVDPKRVYVNGMSNGAMMTHRLALELSDKITAVATVAGNIPEDQSQSDIIPKRAIPVLIISGTDDPMMPWDGGYVVKQPKRGKVISVPETVNYWVNYNNCSQEPIITYEPDSDPNDGTRVRKEVYGNGTNGTEVILYAVEGGGHTWPGGSSHLRKIIIGKTSRDIDANEVIWDFFKAHAIK